MPSFDTDKKAINSNVQLTPGSYTIELFMVVFYTTILYTYNLVLVTSNGKKATVNRALDGRMYPG